jgi:hypothetical protein
MDELAVIVKAHSFIGKVRSLKAPVVLQDYLAEATAVMSVDNSLGADEAGMCMSKNGQHFIFVNGNDTPERQRFTVCHELGHIILGLPSNHADGFNLYSYRRRDQNEIWCDVFASELLLPLKLFKPRLPSLNICFGSIETLADDFEASITSTGSRFAVHNPERCAFVISNNGQVKYAAMSTTLRDLKAFIRPGTTFPASSCSALARAGKKVDDALEIAADTWFQDWRRGGVVMEEARHLSKWDQTLTLLWYDEDSGGHQNDGRGQDEDDEPGLQELDGVLHFHKKSRR